MEIPLLPEVHTLLITVKLGAQIRPQPPPIKIIDAYNVIILLPLKLNKIKPAEPIKKPTDTTVKILFLIISLPEINVILAQQRDISENKYPLCSFPNDIPTANIGKIIVKIFRAIPAIPQPAEKYTNISLLFITHFLSDAL